MGVKELASVEGGVGHASVGGGMGHVSMGKGMGHAGAGRGTEHAGIEGSEMGPGGKGAPPAKGSATGGANVEGPCGKGPGAGDSHALRLGGIARPRPCNTH